MAWIARSTDDSLWIFEEKPNRGTYNDEVI